MATAAVASESPDTECSVCHELFKEPKLLPCAHILCRHCLLSWLAANPEALCPLCRGAIADPTEKSQGQGWEEVVDALPDDVAMAALVESTRVLSQEHVCVGCQSAAVSVCRSCGDLMCQPCSKLHTKFSATSHHKVRDLSSMTAEELAASQPDHCSLHTSKPCELFCPTHGAAICHLCATAKHRACPDLTELAEAADRSREQLSQMVTSLLEGEQQLNEAVSALERHLEATEKAMQEALAEINKTCNQLEQSVKTCRRRLTQMTLLAHTEVKDTVLAIKVTLLDRRGRLTSHRRVADRATRSATQRVMCDVTGALKERVTNLLETLTELPAEWKPISMLTLIFDAAAVTRIEQELSELGVVKVMPVTLTPQQVTGDADSLRKTPSCLILSRPTLTLDQIDTWQFRPSRNVFLTNSNRTANKVSGHHSILFCSTPMLENMLYEVRMDVILGTPVHYFACGVVGSLPPEDSLPLQTLRGWEEAIVLGSSVSRFGTEIASPAIDRRMRYFKEGSRVGLVRDGDGYLQLYIDGRKQWVYVQNAPSQCYVFFLLHQCYKKDNSSASDVGIVWTTEIECFSRMYAKQTIAASDSHSCQLRKSVLSNGFMHLTTKRERH